MASYLVERLQLTNQPVAVLFSDKKPMGAIEGKEGKWACVVPFILAAARGKTTVLERKTTCCRGGKVGLGFGAFENYPGGIELLLSVGKAGMFEGECYKKNPELASAFVEGLPIEDIPFKYVVFKPLAEAIALGEVPELVIFYVNPNQLSALTVLANFARSSSDHVTIPFASGCQSMVLLPLAEQNKEPMRAVVGLMDITVRPMTDVDKMSFAVPYKMFMEMEGNASESFLKNPLWDKVLEKMKK